MIEVNYSFYPSKRSPGEESYGDAQKLDPEEIDMTCVPMPKPKTFDIISPFEGSYYGDVLVSTTNSYVGLKNDTGYRSFDSLETRYGSVYITIRENYNNKGELVNYTLIKRNENGDEYGIVSSKNYSDLFFSIMLSGTASYDRELECYVGNVYLPTKNKANGYVGSVLFKAFAKLEGQIEYDVVKK